MNNMTFAPLEDLFYLVIEDLKSGKFVGSPCDFEPDALYYDSAGFTLKKYSYAGIVAWKLMHSSDPIGVSCPDFICHIIEDHAGPLLHEAKRNRDMAPLLAYKKATGRE